MLSEETLKKYFDAVSVVCGSSFGYHENSTAVQVEKEKLWKKFLAHKNILDEEVEKIQEKAWDDGWESNYHRG